jgi:GntR family transcriptional regulator/MocR family aminotransferase
LQSALADFMEQGHFARHLRKMRALYAVRRAYLTDALSQVFGDKLHVPVRAGGIHVLAYWKAGQTDASLAEAANARGLPIQALSAWHIRGQSEPGLMLGFANLISPAQTLTLVKRLRQAMTG